MKLDDILGYLNSIHKNFPYGDNVPTDGYVCSADCEYYKHNIDSIGIHSSEACNLSCTMCRFALISGSPKDKEIYFSLLNKIKGLGLNTIELTTIGEPFFYKKETFEYLESLTTKDCENVYIITNATLLSHTDIDRLFDISKKSGVNIKIQVSVDSINESTYKLIRRNTKFNTVLDNIKYLNSVGLLTEVSMTIQPLNFWQINLIDKFWSDLGVNYKINLVAEKANVSKKDVSNIKDSSTWKNFIKNHRNLE